MAEPPRQVPIVIGGLAGTGSTTVAELLADQLRVEHVYGGAVFREQAAAAGESIEAFNRTLIDHPELEKEIDQGLIDRVRKGGVVLESRVLAWILPPEVPAYKVWLTCQIDERLQRIQRREPGTTEDITRRERLERRRYQKLYQVSLSDHTPFDLVIDTTKLSAAEVAARVLHEVSDAQ